MATLREFINVSKMGITDKTSVHRMGEIIEVLRKYHVSKGITPDKVASILEALGPTYVKIGQIASNRSDILPKQYCEALQHLHADVDPLPFDVVLQCIDEAYGKSWQEVFMAIDPVPLGSASIAQVHQAVLLDGSVVAVKVRRPGVVEAMTEDLTLMRHLLVTAEFVSTSHQTIMLNFENLLNELERTTHNELDFTIELDNLIKFHEEIEGQPGIASPIPYPEHSNEAVLVMEYVKGLQIDDVKGLEAEGVSMSEMANRLVQSYISQVLDYGFFHADPHPGNILVNEGQIIWIDLGMTGSLTASQRNLLNEIFKSVMSNNAYELLGAVIGLSKRSGQVQYGKLLEELEVLLDRYGSADLSDIDIGSVMSDIVEVMRSQNLIIDPSVSMLVRGLVSLEGVLATIDPSLNVLKVVTEHVMASTLDSDHLKARAMHMAASALGSAEAAAKLPMQLSNTLDMLDKGEVEIKGNIDVPTNTLSLLFSAVDRLSLALISVGLFLGSSLLCTTNMEPRILEVPILGFLGFLGAFVLGIYVIMKTVSLRHRSKNRGELD